ncbi:hypothetical protein [Croceibacter atlanticus]|uniref:hypothetical protein n=1 Tax=Croceibacter atlanticus TaxID=313588 RepID=UPI0030F9001E
MSFKIAIISGRYPNTSFDSVVNHRIYADRYDLTYIHCNWPTKHKNLYFNKLQYLLEYIDIFDAIFWIDDDAFFIDFNIDIRELLPKNEHLISICKSPDFKSLKTPFSSGQFMMVCNEDSKEFLKKALETDLSQVKKWWIPEFGFFSNGDQDALYYVSETHEKFKNCFEYHDYKSFNSRFENLEKADVHSPFILHFTGKPEIKKENYKISQKLLNRDSSLAPPTLLNNYNIASQKKTTAKDVLKGILKKLMRR